MRYFKCISEVMRDEVIQKTGQGIIVLLLIIMFLRINSYFMISENPTITRIFKTGLRSALTGLSLLLLWKINESDRPTTFIYENILAFFFYLCYLFAGIASVGWSSDRAWSMLQLAMDFECVFFVLYYWKALMAFNDQDRFLKHLHLDKIIWVSSSWIAFYFLIGAIVNPDMFFRGTHGGEVQRLGGWVINPNELGMLCVVAAGCLYVDVMREGLNIWKILGWICLVVALLLTQSRSSLISFFLTTFYFVLASKNAKLIVPTFVIGIGAAPVLFMTIFVKDGDVGEVMSMTGRLPFWADLLTYGFTERPWYGYGFMRIHHDLRFPSIHAFPGAMTHNTFMQLLLNLGTIGAVICGLQVLFTFRGTMREKDPFLKHTFMGMVFGVLINSLTEFGIFGDANYAIMWWLFMVFMHMLKANPHRPVPLKQQEYGYT